MDPTIVPWEPAVRLGAFAAVLVLLMGAERIRPWRAPALPRRLRWTANFGLVLLGSGMLRLIAPLAPAGAAIIAARHGWGVLHLVAAPGWSAGPIAFVALDLAIYAQHRVMHRVAFLWRLHRVHHSDIELDVTSGVRFHPFELALSLLVKIVAVIALGAPVLAVIVFELVLNATSLFNHSNIRIPTSWDTTLRRWLVTPAMHRVHQSSTPDETDTNFGFNLPWWDRLFGTYRAAAARGEDIEIGLAAFRDIGSQRLERLLVQPVVTLAQTRS